MNPELLKLFKAINAKKEEVKKFVQRTDLTRQKWQKKN